MNPIDAASRLERTRIRTARFLILHNPFRWAAFKLLPKSHPYTSYASSAYPHWRTTTETALVPRNGSAPLRTTLIAASLIYLAVADVVATLPGIGLVRDPITPLHWAGLTDEPWVAPSLLQLVGLA